VNAIALNQHGLPDYGSVSGSLAIWIQQIGIAVSYISTAPYCPDNIAPLGKITERCGPDHGGGGRCNRNLRPDALYCNTYNGYCGSSELHRLAQPNEDSWDWFPQACRKKETAPVVENVNVKAVTG